MGGKKAPPKPPVIQAPVASPQETELLGKQVDLVNQLMGQSQEAFGQSQDDRSKAMTYLDKLTADRDLSPAEQRISQQLADAMFEQSFRSLTTGANKEIFDRNRRDTLGGLADSGMFNSTTAVELLGGLEKDKLRAIADLAGQSGLQKLGLQRDFYNQGINRDLDIFSTLYGGARAGGAGANQLASSASDIAGQASSKLAEDRLNAFNVNVQNQQANYAYQQQLYNQQQQRRKGLGGLVGGGLGALAGLALAPFTGGLSLFGTALGAGGSALIGGGLGAGIGSSLL